MHSNRSFHLFALQNCHSLSHLLFLQNFLLLRYHTSKVDRVITSSALDYMKHKAAATVEFRFLRNCSLTLTGAVYDRNGSYTYYLRNADGSLMLDPDGKMMTEVRDFKPYFLLDGRLSWEKKGWKLYFDVMNMTDTRYFDFGGLEMPGVWFSGGIVVTIG